MKHSDFLRSLKTLKSRIIQSQQKPHFFNAVPDEDKDITYCSCKDSFGEPKYLYTSQKEVDYMLSSKNISLKIYPCPYEKGWHLTKN